MRESEREREREIDHQHRSVGNHFLGQLSNLFADLPESIDQPECCHLLWTPLQNSMKSYSKKSTRLRSNSTANVMHKSRSCCISSSSGGVHGIFIGQGETPQEHWIRQSWGFSLMRLFDLFKAHLRDMGSDLGGLDARNPFMRQRGSNKEKYKIFHHHRELALG